MSARNRPLEKQVRRLRRALRKGRLVTYIDLYHWLKLCDHAQTTGQATALILDGRVRSESHKLGVRIVNAGDGRMIRVVDPLVPASLRNTLEVVDADA